MKNVKVQTTLILLSIVINLLHIQQAIAHRTQHLPINVNTVIEPEIPPLENAASYLPVKNWLVTKKHNKPLLVKLRNTRLVVKLHQRRVNVYYGDQLQASYPVAIGKAGWATPTGTFKIIDMQQNPAWEHPLTGKVIPAGANNPLGTRWIGFWTDGQNFVGFHGTPQEELVGQAVSHGCLRMRNQDVLALYNLVNIGTPVIVEP